MKNVIRKMTTWLLVFGMTFTPVLAGIDVTVANAEEGTPTITVGEAKEKVETEQKTANTPTPEGEKPTVENTGAQQLIENAQTTVNTEVTNKSGQTLLDTTALSGDLSDAASSIGVGGEDPTGAQKNLADAAAAYDAAKKADDAVTSLLEGSTANAIVTFVQAIDPETGEPKFNEDGTPVWEYETDEEGNPVTDEDGNPVYKTVVVALPIIPESFEGTAQQTEDDANLAIKRANGAKTEEQAKGARAALKSAEDGLSEAEQNVEDAEAAVVAANALAKEALAKKNEAEAKVREAQEALEKALVQTGTDKDGNPVYAGNVEEAEAALQRAVEEAEGLAGDAADAIEAAQDAKLNLVQGKYQAVMDYVNGVEKTNWTDDATYRELARDLCVAVLNNFIEGQIGAEFDYGMNFVADRELIVDWKYKNVDENGNPIPTTRTDEDGNVLCNEDGEPYYFIEYETVYGSFVEKVNGYIGRKDGIGSTDPHEEEDQVYGWISSNKNQDNRVVVQYYQLEVDEDGNPVVDGDGNPVYAKDEDGNKILVTKFYNYKANKDGSIYIFERRYDIVDGEVVVSEVDPVTTKIIDQEFVPGVDPVEGKDEVPESWATEDGGKSIVVDQETKELVLPNETTHVVARPDKEDGSKTGYWVVDTATSEKIGDQIDNADLNEKSENNGRTTVTYTVVEGTEKTDTEYSSYTVTDGYEPKPGPQNKKVNAFNMESEVRALYDQGYDVTLTYHNLITGKDEKVDLDHQNGWQAFKAVIKSLFGINSYTYSTTNTIDDLEKPITHEEDGIFVIKKQDVVETTTVLEAQPTISTSDNRSRNKNSVETDLNNKIAELRGDKNKTNISGEVKSKWVGLPIIGHREYWYEITYDYKTTTTKTIEQAEISRQKYAADTLGKHTDYEAEVLKVEGKDPIEEQSHYEYTYGQDELKKEKVQWKGDTVGAFEGQEVYVASDYLNPLADYQQKLSELQDQQSKLDQAVLDARAALEKVQELKRQLAERQQIQLASVAAYAEYMEKLGQAESLLADKEKEVERLEELVEKARKVVASIRLPQEEDDDTPVRPDDSTPGEDLPAGIDPMTVLLPTAGAASGVAGVRVADADAGEGEGEADAAETPAPAVEENKQEVLEDADLPAAAEPTTIEDDDLAGAQTVEEAASMWWIWLLVVLAVAAGFGVYKYVDNKKKKAGTIDK